MRPSVFNAAVQWFIVGVIVGTLAASLVSCQHDYVVPYYNHMPVRVR